MNSSTVAVEQEQEVQRVPLVVDVARRGVRKMRRVPAVLVRRVAETGNRRIEEWLLRLAMARPRFATLYYFFADRSFDREIHAVLHGKMAHHNRDHLATDDAATSTLSRNILLLDTG